MNCYLKKQLKMTAFLAFLLKVLTYIFYISFVLQTLILMGKSVKHTCLFVAYNTLAFISATLLRRFINRKRPYEKFAVTPVISKDTQGQSFPSRHAFSAWLISFNWLLLSRYIPLNIFIALFILYALMALIISLLRVIFTIHYPSDVIAGALLAMLCFMLFNIKVLC